MPADDARSESFFGEKATTEGRVACASTRSEQRAKAERLLTLPISGYSWERGQLETSGTENNKQELLDSPPRRWRVIQRAN
jgi:hypothetical protein